MTPSRRCSCRGGCGHPHPFRTVIPPWVADVLREAGRFDSEHMVPVGEPDPCRRTVTGDHEWCSTCRSSRPRRSW